MTENTKEPLTQPKWWLQGLIWGAFMFISMEILVNPLIFGEPITQKKLFIGIPIWTIGGLLFGLWMKKIRKRRKSN